MKFAKYPLIALGVVLLAGIGSYAWTAITKPSIHTSVDINADPDAVWEILTDFDAYSEWNPFIIHSSGAAEVGAQLHNTLRNGETEMEFAPTIVVADPGSELRWIGQFLLPGIIKGEHYFLIEEISPGRVRFIQGEDFRGALVPFAGSALDVEDGFDAMNQALKKKAEEERDARVAAAAPTP
ncbi:SRPBCC domain-containing protein [Hoyosella altamirensis]|uniref:SRPBCC domain-containing protein n=1 Tax=Hoyosella altamirensis TaxID=616997 RepID=A0A839RNK2_9ACTN|nr:SRPBCC domain-containing protein [Hoyosella altamirensis]MBB3037957.1 hypothetical protein [Hoyosella altamirensis]